VVTGERRRVIFTPDQARLIRQARKTQTRVPAAGDDCPYHVGRVYQVRPKGAPKATAKITIRAVRLELLTAITLDDARREGFGTTAAFLVDWSATHRIPTIGLDVWVLSFALGDTRDTVRLLRRSQPQTPICANCKRGLPDDTSRCPSCNRARPQERDDDHGYTSRLGLAAHGEPEAIPATLQEAYSTTARTRDRAGGAAATDATVARLQVELDLLRHADMTGVLEHREAARDISRIERSLAALTKKLSGRLLQ
jgi:hypothetical protein